MEILDSLAHLAGRLLRPLRSDESRLASRRLDPQLHTLEVRSHCFPNGAQIPPAYSGDEGRSPELSWSHLPPATEEVAWNAIRRSGRWRHALRLRLGRIGAARKVYHFAKGLVGQRGA